MKKLSFFLVSLFLAFLSSGCTTSSGNYHIYAGGGYPALSKDSIVRLGSHPANHRCPGAEKKIGSGSYTSDAPLRNYLPGDLSEKVLAAGGNKVILHREQKTVQDKEDRTPIYRSGRNYAGEQVLTGYNTRRYKVTEYSGSFDIFRCEAFLKEDVKNRAQEKALQEKIKKGGLVRVVRVIGETEYIYYIKDGNKEGQSISRDFITKKIMEKGFYKDDIKIGTWVEYGSGDKTVTIYSGGFASSTFSDHKGKIIRKTYSSVGEFDLLTPIRIERYEHGKLYCKEFYKRFGYSENRNVQTDYYKNGKIIKTFK